MLSIAHTRSPVASYCGGGGGAADGQSKRPSALCGESCSESARELYSPPSPFVTSHAAEDWFPEECKITCAACSKQVSYPSWTLSLQGKGGDAPISQSVKTEGASGGVVISVAMLFPDTASVIVEATGFDDGTGVHGEPTP